MIWYGRKRFNMSHYIVCQMQYAKNTPRDVPAASAHILLFWPTIDGSSRWPSCRESAGSFQFTGCAPNCTLFLFASNFTLQVCDRYMTERIKVQGAMLWPSGMSQLCVYYTQQYVLGKGSRSTHERKKKSTSPAGMMYFWRPSWQRSRCLDRKPFGFISFDFVLLRWKSSVANNKLILLAHFDMTCNFKIHRWGFKQRVWCENFLRCVSRRQTDLISGIKLKTP